MQDRLIFLISPPRSGSTLLERMLSAHSQIAGGPEPHLLTPLAHLGYFERVDSAAYDPVISQEGIRELVARLPGGEEEYLAACRAYTDRLYQNLLDAQPGHARLLDKTPAYSLVLPFIAKLYPRAHYVVLTRTPLAVLSSQASSFFDGDFEEAVRLSPVVERYVPAIARFLREAQVPKLHVSYEALVSDPRAKLEGICDFLGLPFEESAIEYGAGSRGTATGARGLGDPTGVAQHGRPVTGSIEKWVGEIAGHPTRRDVALRSLQALDPADLETWGYSKAEIERQLEEARPAGAPRAPKLTRYRLERKLLVAVRRGIRGNVLGRLVQRIRLLCDLLLR